MAFSVFTKAVLLTVLLSCTCIQGWYTTWGWPDRTDADRTTWGWPDRTDADRTTWGWPDRTDGDRTTWGWPDRTDGDRTTWGWPDRTDADRTTWGWPDRTDGDRTTWGWPDRTDGDRTTWGWPDRTDGERTTWGWPDRTDADRTTEGWPEFTSESPIERRPFCQSGWTRRGETCYAYMPLDGRDMAIRTWGEADGFCRRVAGANASLAAIHNYEENDVVASLMNNEGATTAWIGLYFNRKSYRYNWQDASYMDYTHWEWGYPTNDETQGCVSMNNSWSYGRWTHDSCSTPPDGFVCQTAAADYFLNVRRDDYGCRTYDGYEGYGDDCYQFHPDMYSRDYIHDACDYPARPVMIRSADENEFIVERMRKLSVYEPHGRLRLHAQYSVHEGWVWSEYWETVTFMNFDRRDGYKPKTPATIDVDLRDGKWTMDTSPGLVMGEVCVSPRYGMTGEKGEGEVGAGQEVKEGRPGRRAGRRGHVKTDRGNQNRP